MLTQIQILWFVVAALYVLGAYAFNLMLKAADLADGTPSIRPSMIRFLTVIWVVVIVLVLFRDRKTA